MPSSYSRSISQLSTSTLDHQWDPYQVLDLERDQRCVGWAPSKGRKCLHTVNRGDKSEFHRCVDEISTQLLDAAALRTKLHHLASRGLCLQVHRRSQVDSMVEKWTKKIDTAVRLAQEQAIRQQYRPRSESTTESFGSTWTRSPPGRRVMGPPSATLSASTLSAESEAESLRRSIAAMQATIDTALRRLEHISSPETPRIEPAHPLDRVQTSDISSARLSTSSSRTLSAVSARSSSARSSTRSASSTQSTSSRHSSFTASSDPSPPAPPAAPLRTQTPAATTTGTSNRAQISASSPTETHEATRRHLQTTQQEPTTSAPSGIQNTSPIPTTDPMDISTPNLSTSISSTPYTTSPASLPTTPTPSSSSTSDCRRTHVRRLPTSSEDDCPICYESMGASAQEWCRSGCGQSVHVECMDVWRAQCVEFGREVSCVMCRSGWGSCGC